MESKPEERIAIYLTKEEAEDFKWFMQYRKVWKKARQLRPGKLILNFNSSGEIKDREFYTRES